jgi:hypothetical protein
MVGFRLVNAIHADLIRIAQRDDRTVGSIVSEAVAEYVKRDAKRASRRSSRKQRVQA